MRRKKATFDPSEGMVTATSLVMPYPIRPGFLAQLVIPKDMTKSEADRLCAFVKAIVMPGDENENGLPERDAGVGTTDSRV